MKGVVLAGGLGSRLGALTKTQNKHLLPVFDKPMIYYPLQTLANAGIKEVMIVVSGPFAGNFVPLLKNGEEFGFDRLVYGYQDKPDGGIADALSIARSFAANDDILVILGDNCTDADIYTGEFKVPSQTPCAKLFLKRVSDSGRYGVPIFDGDTVNGPGKIVSIIEKPKTPVFNLGYAVTGLYIYDEHVFKFIDQIKPSERGELEITDINNLYLQNGRVSYSILNGFWQDAGTPESLFDANKYWASK